MKLKNRRRGIWRETENTEKRSKDSNFTEAEATAWANRAPIAELTSFHETTSLGQKLSISTNGEENGEYGRKGRKNAEERNLNLGLNSQRTPNLG